MALSLTPPAGWAVKTAGSSGAAQLQARAFPPEYSVFTASGTVALALALSAARERRPHIAQPEAVLPAYACPSLVSACVYAGVRPVLCDLADANAPWMCLEHLQRRINSNTVAVIAVHLAAMAERLDDVADALPCGVSLIEDSAQLFDPSRVLPMNADFRVFSFARGKPLSLLGGGALRCARQDDADTLRTRLQVATASKAGWQIRRHAYNVLRQPLAFGLLSRMPGTGVGQTRMHSLTALGSMDAHRREALAAGLEGLLRPPVDARMWSACLDDAHGSVTNLSDRVGTQGVRGRHLYLAGDASQAQTMHRALRSLGIGATRLYQQVVADCAGVPAGLADHPFPHARAFAARLVTLPVIPEIQTQQLEAATALLRQPALQRVA